jgi:hypothetical protein
LCDVLVFASQQTMLQDSHHVTLTQHLSNTTLLRELKMLQNYPDRVAAAHARILMILVLDCPVL